MKLFRQLLVAPAALGLLLPLSVNATEVNINGIESYSNLEQEEESLDYDFSNTSAKAIDAPYNPSNVLEAGSFSSTTVMSGSASFLLSGQDGDPTNQGDEESTQFNYYYGLSLDTTFTGDDNLNVVIEAGNSTVGADAATVMDFGSATGDKLTVVDLNYTRSFGDKFTAVIGDSLDLSALFTGACTYSGFTDHLSDCGTGFSAGAGGDVSISTSYDVGNGFTFGAGLSAVEGASADGMFTKEGVDVYGMQLAYTADSYGLAVSYGNVDMPVAADAALYGGLTMDHTFWGLNGYYTFGGPLDSVNVGYEFADPETGDDKTNYFIGLTTAPVGPGTFNFGLGTSALITEGTEETMQYEASYGWDINDSISATVGGFIVERVDGTGDDLTGFALQTNFVF